MAKIKYKYQIGDRLKITNCINGHHFAIGTIVEVFRRGAVHRDYDVCDKVNGDCWWVEETEVELFERKKQNKMDIKKIIRAAVENTANKLMKANGTATTLEIKSQLRKDYPYFHWIQNSDGVIEGVSDIMNDFSRAGNYTYTTNGTYRVYSPFTPAMTGGITIAVGANSTIITEPSNGKTKSSTFVTKKISRSKAEDLIRHSKGHFFTAEFIKNGGNGDSRTINCQYMKEQKSAAPGCVMVKETSKLKTGANPIRQINIATLNTLKIGGVNYKVK